jgi:adenylate cyclase
MFADMAGYTAATQSDEAGTLKLIQEQEELVRPLLAMHRGRGVKSTGDGFLAEFDSALHAVQCAIDIQQHLHERNAQPGNSTIPLRIGIHLGDVEERGTDIFGDAVNIAARIEPLANPGGICISGQVFDQVENKLPIRYEKLGPQRLKNVRSPVEIYRVVLPWSARAPPAPSSGSTRLAVLPFSNISPDPKDEYFADGLTEELITVLSQLRGLRVIARTSVSQYRSTSKSVPQIGAELGVEAVLEGSVRKAGDELRITVQLIDVDTQEHAWASTYDRKLENVFAVQSEIAKQVAEALEIELQSTESARLETRPTVRPESYLAYLKGRTLMHTVSPASFEAAKAQFELAVSLDDRNASAHSGLADVTIMTGWYFPSVPYSEWHESGRRLVKRALELDSNIAEAHVSLAMVLWSERDYIGIERELKLALSLNPSYALAHEIYAGVLEDEGRADEALLEFDQAEEADPISPTLLLHARLLIWLGRLDEALVKIQKVGKPLDSTSQYHNILARYFLARQDLERGLKEIQLTEELLTEPSSKPLYRAFYYALSGEKEKARALLRSEESRSISAARQAVIVSTYAELGDIDECYRWMEAGPPTQPLQALRLSPRFEGVRRDPRFQPLLKKMNLA